ncbi:hypothetical protein HZH66_008534 [Vespula vulgaris]|uniref:Uncharacterized protein n=1 Tax=Vespula vulgaris TaxID=7454 RepID=A0A834JW83_VESVU|nr:hypothetical protein HZH66_008534 [Vespula vulgaris]
MKRRKRKRKRKRIEEEEEKEEEEEEKVVKVEDEEEEEKVVKVEDEEEEKEVVKKVVEGRQGGQKEMGGRRIYRFLLVPRATDMRRHSERRLEVDGKNGTTRKAIYSRESQHRHFSSFWISFETRYAMCCLRATP